MSGRTYSTAFRSAWVFALSAGLIAIAFSYWASRTRGSVVEGMPRKVSIETIATFPRSYLALLTPWSPRGTLLAIMSSEGIRVIDAAGPTEMGRVLVGQSAYVVW
jgi:hypothetical protein